MLWFNILLRVALLLNTLAAVIATKSPPDDEKAQRPQMATPPFPPPVTAVVLPTPLGQKTGWPSPSPPTAKQQNNSNATLNDPPSAINVTLTNAPLPPPVMNCTNNFEEDQYCISEGQHEALVQDRIDELLLQHLNTLEPAEAALLLEELNKTNEVYEKSGRDHQDILYRPACNARVESVSPSLIYGNKGDMLYVVRSQKYHIKQKITIEICLNEDSACNLMGMNSKCRQNYVKRSFFVMDSAGARMVQQERFFPSACSCYIINNKNSIVDPCRMYRNNAGFEKYDDVKHLGHIDDIILKRSKRDKLDHLDHHFHPHQHHHDNSIGHSNHGSSKQTLGSVISNFVKGKKTFGQPVATKKQLVCFTQNVNDNLFKNLDKAINFNNIINHSTNEIVRNNRNVRGPERGRALHTNTASRKSTDDKRRKNLKDWLNISKNDINFLAKNLNKKLTPPDNIAAPPTVLIPPKSHSSQFNVFNTRHNSLPNDLHTAASVRSSSSDRNHFDESSIKIQKNGFRPLFNPPNNDPLKFAVRQNQNGKINSNENVIRERSFDTNSDRSQNTFHNTVFDEGAEFVSSSAAHLVDSLVQNPQDPKHLKNFLFPNNPDTALNVRKARTVLEQTINTRKNGKVRIQSFDH